MQESILAVALVHTVAVASPGANFLVVTRNALSQSRRSGLVTARGVALGSLCYLTIGSLGFATVISSSPLLFDLIRIFGAVYFVYAGIRALATLRRQPTLAAKMEGSSEAPPQGAFLSGLITALSNPTSALYFVALFTTFIPASALPGEKALMALVLISISFSWYTLVALTFSHPRVRRVYARFERWLNGLIGFLWLALALKLLLA